MSRSILYPVIAAIVIFSVATVALYEAPVRAEAAFRNVVIDRDMYRASDVLGSKRLTSESRISLIFDEKGNNVLVGKTEEDNAESDHNLPGALLYIAQADGTGERLISKEPVRNAFFDKNGENVIYLTQKGELYKGGVSVSESQKLTHEAVTPHLSDDGAKIVYQKTPPGWTPGDFYEGSPGFAILDLATGEEIMVPNTNKPGDYAPILTPDSKHILFFNEGLHIIDVDGNNRTQLTQPGDGTGTYGISDDPLWSADGKYFLYHADNTVMAVELDIANKRVISAGPVARGVNPRWTDEGKNISVESADTQVDQSQLSVFDLNGKFISGDRNKEIRSTSREHSGRVSPRDVATPSLDQPKQVPAERVRINGESPAVPKEIPASAVKRTNQ
jgi:hypothetical protein